MSTTTETREQNPTVHSVDADGVRVRTTEGIKRLSWATLRAAATQQDKATADAYRPLLATAEHLASLESPVDIRVTQDHTNVWWIVKVTAAWGGGHVQLWPGKGWAAADQGITHAHRNLAADEARDVAAKLRARGREVYVDA